MTLERVAVKGGVEERVGGSGVWGGGRKGGRKRGRKRERKVGEREGREGGRRGT